MQKKVTWWAIALCMSAILGQSPQAAEEETRLLRYPDISGQNVVFCYGGDLWLSSVDGGQARRLTAHAGQELFPRFSPDGQWIAFTGQYDGDEQVYVMPATGGEPRRLTWYPARGPLPPRWGYDNQVYDWTADGKSVLFRSMRYGASLTDTRLFLASVDGGLPSPLPMPVSGAGDLSPDGKRIVYSPLVRDFRTWKRYQGGWAQELYIFDLDSHELTQVTDHPRADRDPMWIGESIYFNSDRTGTLNLYAHDTGSGATRQLTDSTTWDVRWPADDGQGRIIYELNGGLQIHDIAAGRSRAISIQVPDDGLARRPSRTEVNRNIEGFSLSPGGERALFVARGDVFTVPAEKGPTRNLTSSPGAHDKWARWSPDGKQIAFISDRDGEEEIYLVPQDGSGEAERLTHDGEAMRYAPEWSPDSSHLAFSDKNGRLYVVNAESGRKFQVADDPAGQLRDYVWSPHGGHLAFSMNDANGFSSLYVWTLADRELHRITDESFNEFSPAWDPQGNYLYYMSDREFSPQIGSFEFNYALDRESFIYVLGLRADVKPPFPAESDEVKIEEADAGKEDEAKKPEGEKEASEKGDDKADAEEEDDEDQPVVIEFEGLAQRVARVPVEADNYGSLAAVEGHLIYVRGTPFVYGRSAGTQRELRIFSMEDREATTLASDIQGGSISEDGKKILIRQGRGFKILDASPKGKDSGKAVSTSGLVVDLVPAEEWAQIFDEVWRRYRDFFYVQNMHGYDWEGLRRQYRPLLKHVAHRSDLNYLIGEMIAELNVGHAYIGGGDFEMPSRAPVALAGAEFVLDKEAGRYRIARILPGQNQEDEYRSPLTEIGVDAREGDYVLAIDGEDLQAGDNPYRLLRYKSDRPVELTLNDSAQEDGARKVIYEPLTNESSLRYLDMVLANRQRVDELSDGKVGYLHIPDMGSAGISEFIKWYYGQIRKEGLVVDVRGNGGGNVSQMIIERLNRDLLGTRFSRNNDFPRTYPAVVFHGPMVCLLSEDSASDGDIFPHMFRQAGLGPLIGKRSWGGVTGITNRGTLIDGGSVFVPEFGTNAVDGSWVIEGHGVDPDIEVESDARAILEGRDPQLERGVQEVLKQMTASPQTLPQRPSDPVKTQ